MEHAREKHELSERHACRLVKQWRGTQRYVPIQRVDEDALTRAIITLASEYGRYGYRRITALLRATGWQVGKDRVQRIWRREGLKIPKKQKPRRRLWFNDGSCVRLSLRFFLRMANASSISTRSSRQRKAPLQSNSRVALSGARRLFREFNWSTRRTRFRVRNFGAVTILIWRFGPDGTRLDYNEGQSLKMP